MSYPILGIVGVSSHIYTSVSMDELKKLIKLVEVCRMELECARDNK